MFERIRERLAGDYLSYQPHPDATHYETAKNVAQLRRDGWGVLEIWEFELKDLPNLEGPIRGVLEQSSTPG